MGVPEIEAFLSHLAVDLNVASSTQNQAFNALLFLYRNVLGIELNEKIQAIRAKRGLPSAQVDKLRAGVDLEEMLFVKTLLPEGGMDSKLTCAPLSHSDFKRATCAVLRRDVQEGSL